MNDLRTQTWIEPFSRREVEILRLISEGMSNNEISQKLLLSPDTIKWYNKQIFGKLGVKSRTQAARIAGVYGLIESQETEREEVHSGNLPSPLTSFVGRAKEIAEIKQLLKSSRLIVLTGPGGCGKSRLASQAAMELSPTYRDGTWLVEFASINDPSLAANAIVQALQVNASGDTNLAEVLKRFLAQKHLLLLLDNLEHLSEAYPLVGELLATSPHLTVLATSRERLHIYGEQEYSVHPLELPDSKTLETKQQLLGTEAVNLFVQRARGVQPGFLPDDRQLSLIAEICIRLDGLPLAIELAASMIKTHPLPLLAQRLKSSLDALTSGPRNLPARQRTLRATLDWSYNLLQIDEKKFFARLAIFRGGSTLDAVLSVCNFGISGNPLDILSALVEKNLVYTRQGSDGEQRFMMLETIHEYARERLYGFEEDERVQNLHADFYTRLVEVADAEIHSSKQDMWFAHLRAEQGNLHSVLLWSLNGNDVEYGLRLVVALFNYWFYNGLAAEGRRWAELALEKSTDATLALRAGVSRCAGHIAFALNDFQRGKELLLQAQDFYEKAGDERNVAWSMVFRGGLYVENFQEISLGMQICSQGLNILQKLEDNPGIAQAYNILGEQARLKGDYEIARQYYEKSLFFASKTGERQREAVVFNNLSFVAYHQQDYQRALEYAQKCLIIARELNNEYRQACFIATSAGPFIALGQARRAVLVLGASHARFDALGTRHQPADQAEFELFRSAARNELGEAGFQDAWQAGQALTLQEAVAVTLSNLAAADK